MENQNEVELPSEKWSLVQEGVAGYEKGEVVPWEKF
jgi:hypothetical protein